MLSKIVAKRYAGALLSAVAAKSQVEQAEKDLQLAVKMIEGEPALAKFLANPQETPAAKKDLVGKAFAGVLPEVLNLFFVLIDKKRLEYLPEIVAAYQEEANRVRGIAVAKVKSAQPLTPEGLEVISNRLRSLTGREVKLVAELDPAVVGGVFIRVGNKIIDATLSKQLDDLKEALMTGSAANRRRVRRKSHTD